MQNLVLCIPQNMARTYEASRVWANRGHISACPSDSTAVTNALIPPCVMSPVRPTNKNVQLNILSCYEPLSHCVYMCTITSTPALALVLFLIKKKKSKEQGTFLMENGWLSLLLFLISFWDNSFIASNRLHHFARQINITSDLLCWGCWRVSLCPLENCGWRLEPKWDPAGALVPQGSGY